MEFHHHMKKSFSLPSIPICVPIAWCFSIGLILMTANMQTKASLLPGAELQKWPANAENHEISIVREAENETAKNMIAAAEAAAPPVEALNAAKEEHGSDNDTNWAHKEELGILIPYAITSEAVDYFTELVGKFQEQSVERYIEPSSHFSYRASVTFHENFTLNDTNLANVHVVTLWMEFSQNFATTMTEGMFFSKERTVILDEEGHVVHIDGDGDTHVPIVAI